MNDTPETDAEANNGSLCDQCVPVDFARKLERERDEAREYADKLVAHKDMVCLPKDLEVLREANLGLAVELHEAREETIRTREFMGRGFAKAKEELATMETRHAATMMHAQSVVEDANQLREQRDAVTLRLGNTQERMFDAEMQRDRLIKSIEPLKYWRDISECDCSNPLPQGGCLRCDLNRILKTTNPNDL